MHSSSGRKLLNALHTVHTIHNNDKQQLQYRSMTSKQRRAHLFIRNEVTEVKLYVPRSYSHPFGVAAAIKYK